MYDKLPTDTRQHMARSHTSHDWTLTELRQRVLTEIKVLEAGRIVDSTKPSGNLLSMMTVSFYAGESSRTPRHREQTKPMSCIYYHSTTHSPCFCNTVTDQQKRLEKRKFVV